VLVIDLGIGEAVLHHMLEATNETCNKWMDGWMDRRGHDECLAALRSLLVNTDQQLLGLIDPSIIVDEQQAKMMMMMMSRPSHTLHRPGGRVP
jgi:hypothetical protein